MKLIKKTFIERVSLLRNLWSSYQDNRNNQQKYIVIGTNDLVKMIFAEYNDIKDCDIYIKIAKDNSILNSYKFSIAVEIK